MKKISCLSLLTALVLPAFAEEPVVTEQTEPAVSAELAQQFEQPKYDVYSNPKTKFPHGMQLGLGVSPTTGLNAFVGYNNKNFDSFWWKRFGVRLDFASTKPVKSFINKTIDRYMGDEGIEINDEISIVDGSIKSQHMGALVDFYPFGDTWFFGGWRITGGYMVGDLDMDADLKGTVKGLPAGTVEFEFDGTKYRYLGNEVYGTATADWKFHGPYAGTGFDLGLFAGFKIYMDAGVVFTNKAAELDIKVDDIDNLQYNDGGTWKPFAGNQAVIDEFYARKDAELKDAQDELDKYKFYPIVKLGFMYRF